MNGTIKVNPCRFSADLSGKSAASAAPTASTNGVEVPSGWYNEQVILKATKANTATVRVWGYDGSDWSIIGTATFAENANESTRVMAGSAFQRLATQITALAAGSCNTYLGFGE